MNFNEYNYQRPDLESLKSRFGVLVDKFKNARSFQEQDEVMVEINLLRRNFESMSEIASIRHTIDTTDTYYEQEQEYFDESTPIYQGLVSDFYRELVASKQRPNLENKWGRQLFQIAEMTLRTFRPEIIEDLQVENKLTTEYMKLIASASIMFEGEERNLPGLGPFQQSTDRIMRKRASEAKYGFFAVHEADLDRIYDQLVKVRHQIAQKLGYKDYVGLGYDRMLRSDYTPEMVAGFRRQVAEHIVPAASGLRERQRQRLGLETLLYFDEAVEFLKGNAKPQGDAEWIVDNGRRLFGELSSETAEFFEFMTEHGLMDLVSKKGKAGGGYCTYISEYRSPFIFSNFNGTSGDVDVLTHESGHAFQVYSSRNFVLPEYQWPTYESCEIHSMSMEFWAWPWMELFFKEDADKYRFAHLSDALLFIPYGVSVDEFQHFVYSNPGATVEERKQAWRAIEKKYLPHRNYAENDYLEKGSYWHQQSHIFTAPFYYIDYTLAQVCAFQFWQKSREIRDAAWQDYLNLCRLGGSLSFLELVKQANLTSPFEKRCVPEVIQAISAWLAGVDDSKF